MKLTGTGVLAVAGVAAGVLLAIRYAPNLKAAAAKLNPASRDNALYQATGEWGTHVPDLFGGLFKSDAEREVDAMLATPIIPQPTYKTVLKPTAPSSGYENSPASFGTSARAVGEPAGPSWEGFYGN